MKLSEIREKSIELLNDILLCIGTIDELKQQLSTMRLNCQTAETARNIKAINQKCREQRALIRESLKALLMMLGIHSLRGN